jgi:RNA polymerase sigma factor (sigma-70 family)
VDELRRRQRQQSSLETLGGGLDAAERRSVSESDLSNALRCALASLPSAQREVVLRRLLHGQRFSEVAVALETTEGAVKMRFRRGLELLRERLREEGYAP